MDVFLEKQNIYYLLDFFKFALAYFCLMKQVKSLQVRSYFLDRNITVQLNALNFLFVKIKNLYKQIQLKVEILK